MALQDKRWFDKRSRVQPGAKVLVSGANGFIAIWVVHALLEKGYSVRGTVRTAEKGEHLKKLFEKYGDKHEVVVVEDITKVNYHCSLLWGLSNAE